MRTLFSTESIHAKSKFRRWSEVIFDRIVPVEQSALGEIPFDGKIETADVGSLLISRISQSALRTEATPATIRRHDKHDTLTVTIKLAGVSTTAQDDRDSVQRRGDIVVVDRRPTVLSSSAGSRSYLLEVPRARLEDALGCARSYAALTIGSDLASASLVKTFFEELVRVQARLDPDTAERMASVGIDLLVASIADRLARDVPKPLYGTVVVQRAKAHIQAHLGDPMLDPGALAAAVGVSLRRLQELFQERGQCVSDWIWRCRLERAALWLADSGRSHMSIGELAYGCGFISQAHFARRFRDRYGTTPSDHRRRAFGDPP